MRVVCRSAPAASLSAAGRSWSLKRSRCPRVWPTGRASGFPFSSCRAVPQLCAPGLPRTTLPLCRGCFSPFFFAPLSGSEPHEAAPPRGSELPKGPGHGTRARPSSGALLGGELGWPRCAPEQGT